MKKTSSLLRSEKMKFDDLGVKMRVYETAHDYYKKVVIIYE